MMKVQPIDAMAEDLSRNFARCYTYVRDRISKEHSVCPNLDKLALHLKNPEYQKDAKIQVVKAERNGETIPTHIPL